MNNFQLETTPWGFWVLSSGNIIAGVMRHDFRRGGVSFITPDSFSLQVAVMEHPKGHQIQSHYHLPVPRALVGTQEVLLVQQGILRADLFDKGNSYLGSVNLGPGDLIVLNSGGHGFTPSEDCRFFEVKQGPFVEGADKAIFENEVGTKTPIRIIA